MENERRYILGRGELYLSPRDQWKGPLIKFEPPQPFHKAQEYLLERLNQLKETVSKIEPKKRVDEIVLTVPVHPKYIAKSFYPSNFFKIAGVEEVGSRRWQSESFDRGGQSKAYFIRGSERNISQLEAALRSPESSFPKLWKQDVCIIEDIKVLQPNEQLLGFDSNWSFGRVEFVLHPFGEYSDAVLTSFISLLEENGVDSKTIHYRQYPNGPTFCSVKLDKDQLQATAGFNPLRTAHPMKTVSLPQIRVFSGNSPLPLPPSKSSKSRIVIGVFDGGCDINLSHLNGFTTNEDMTKAPIDKDCILHGTAVAGAILYGPLNQYEQKSNLPVPEISVREFRVLPLSDPTDIDLYEVIDSMESIVPQIKDIKVYNLSLGPEGYIIDDEITRFTYAIDLLSYNEDIHFTVAVGNDGELPAPFNRIQSPSDSINNIGVGAWTYKITNGKVDKIRAPYSSVGMGREGAKLKPDISAFGGCSQHPFHAISTIANQKLFCSGTSFASPLVARQLATIIGRSEGLSALAAKALLIHRSEHPNGNPDFHLGHGCIPDDISSILSCNSDLVTVIFQGALVPKTYASLPITLPDKINSLGRKGRVKVSWTIATCVKPIGQSPDDYTEATLEHRFYPHSYKYKIKNPLTNQSKLVDINKDAKEIDKLISDGWDLLKEPMTESGNIYRDEQSARKIDAKWDSVIHRIVGPKYASSFFKPYLEIHALSRGGTQVFDRIKYAVIVSVHVPDYAGDLYEEVLSQWSQLIPVRIRSINEIMIPVIKQPEKDDIF